MVTIGQPCRLTEKRIWDAMKKSISTTQNWVVLMRSHAGYLYPQLHSIHNAKAGEKEENQCLVSKAASCFHAWMSQRFKCRSPFEENLNTFHNLNRETVVNANQPPQQGKPHTV